MGLTPKWCTFCILSDDINIVGDIPYKFGAIQLWSQQCLCTITICVSSITCVSSAIDSSDGSLTKMMHILYAFWLYSDFLWHIIEIWSHLAQKSCIILLVKVSISEDSDGAYTKDDDTYSISHLYLELWFVYSSIANNVKLIYSLISMIPLWWWHASPSLAFSTSND